MLFKPELIDKILAGEKTQTRRLLNEWDRLIINSDGIRSTCTGPQIIGRPSKKKELSRIFLLKHLKKIFPMITTLF